MITIWYDVNTNNYYYTDNNNNNNNDNDNNDHNNTLSLFCCGYRVWVPWYWSIDSKHIFM